MVINNSSIKTHPIEVLFDSGATHSFIVARLVSKMQGTLTSKHSTLSIALLDGKIVNCQELFIDWLILIHSHELLADLYRFELTELDVTFGINLLFKH